MQPRISFKEMCVLRILEINPLVPHYWSELLTWAYLLFKDDAKLMGDLHSQVGMIENMVLTPGEVGDGLGIYDIEMALESNPDYYAYFVKNGRMVSKFDVERKLNRLRQFVLNEVSRIAEHMRFNPSR